MRIHPLILCLIIGLITLTGCPDPEENNDTPDMSDMSDDSTKEMTLTCETGFMICGDKCVRIDENNCGECGRSCGRGALCNIDEGTCGCLNGGTWCGIGQCLKTLNDSRNCGACGKQCPSAHYCVDGECTEAGEIAEVVRLTNEVRSKPQNCNTKGMFGAVPPLTVNLKLNLAAQAHSEDMRERNFFAHDAPQPKASTPTERMRAAGYTGRLTGENIARGQRSPAAVVQAWLESDGHCANMMNAGYTEIGVGFVKEGYYWTQNFGAP